MFEFREAMVGVNRPQTTGNPPRSDARGRGLLSFAEALSAGAVISNEVGNHMLKWLSIRVATRNLPSLCGWRVFIILGRCFRVRC